MTVEIGTSLTSVDVGKLDVVVICGVVKAIVEISVVVVSGFVVVSAN